MSRFFATGGSESESESSSEDDQCVRPTAAAFTVRYVLYVCIKVFFAILIRGLISREK